MVLEKDGEDQLDRSVINGEVLYRIKEEKSGLKLQFHTHITSEFCRGERLS